MQYRIIMKDSFSVIGKATLISCNDKYKQLPCFWRDCHNDGTIGNLHSFSGDTIMGIGGCDDENGYFDYMIGIVSDMQPPCGWTSRIIPASTWVVFDPVISTPDLVGPVWEYIFNDFLPNGDYKHSNTPDLEVNYRLKNSSAGYSCEIWIPVTKKF